MSGVSVAGPEATDPCLRRCIVCLFPAASVILSLGFTVVYLIALWLVSARLAATVINRRASPMQALRRP